MCRLRFLSELHQKPLRVQFERWAGSCKVLEEMQRTPLIHAWQLHAGDTLLDAHWLRICIGWGLSPQTQDSQGRTLLYKACMVRHMSAGICDHVVQGRWQTAKALLAYMHSSCTCIVSSKLCRCGGTQVSSQLRWVVLHPDSLEQCSSGNAASPKLSLDYMRSACLTVHRLNTRCCATGTKCKHGANSVGRSSHAEYPRQHRSAASRPGCGLGLCGSSDQDPALHEV